MTEPPVSSSVTVAEKWVTACDKCAALGTRSTSPASRNARHSARAARLRGSAVPSPDRGRYVITKLTNEAVGAEFLEDRLKYVATQAILQIAVPRCIALLLDDSPEAMPITVADLTSSEGRIIPVWMAQAVIKRGVKDERWEVIEILYGTAALAGLPPLKLIAQELEIPERTAAYWVQEARTAGWLAGLTSNLGRPSSDRPDAATPPSS